jgi:hypothetical protein
MSPQDILESYSIAAKKSAKNFDIAVIREK